MSLADALGLQPQHRPPISQHVEHEEEEEQQANEDDLFGGSEVDSPPPDGLTSPERKRRKALEYDEDEEPQDIIQLREADVQIPNVPVPKSSDGDYWVLRMSNFVKLDPKPFHPDTYVGPEHEEEEATQADTLKERSMFIKLEVENTVRWRWRKDPDGNNNRKQSNSRLIRWSDGSLSLLLGKELFDINQTVDTSALAPRSALGGSSQSQSQSQPQTANRPAAPAAAASRTRGAGLTYLVAQHKRAEVLQAEKVVTGHFTLRPTSMQSETHRKLVRAVGQKHNKVARLKMAPSELLQKDPEGELAVLAKSMAKAKPKRQGRRAEDPFFNKKKRKSRDDLDDVKMEDDDEEEPYESDESELKVKKKKRAAGDDARRGVGEYLTSDGFVVSDEEDEAGERLGKKVKREDEEVTKDALDEAEEKLEQAAAKKRKSGKKDDPEEEDEDEEDTKMDVESEEEEEEEEEEEDDDFGARKSQGRGRKRIAVEDEEEEE